MMTPARAAMLGSHRSTHVRIDLDAFAANVRWFRQRIGPATELMAVVKANGYGHGARMIGRAAVAAGASHLAVATVDEGVQLRRAGLSAPVLVLGPIAPDEIEEALGFDLTIAVGDLAMVDAIGLTAGRLSRPAPVSVHLKVDTGMRRFGALPRAAVDLARRIDNCPQLSLQGVFTHFATADEEDGSFTHHQAELLQCCVKQLRSEGLSAGLVHAANSAAAVRFDDCHFDMVRVGIALYGLPYARGTALPTGLKPVLELRSRVARVFELVAGETVSYGRSYQAKEPERVALVPLGYADGYPRAAANRGWMAINGERAPVRGRVCMDQTVIGIPMEDTIAAGDDVIAAGGRGSEAPAIAELADLVGTISYEIVTGITARVPRVYLGGGQVVAVEDLAGLHMEEATC